MLTESWMGRMSFSSRLPQYLTTAMLTGAVHVTTLCIFNSRWHYVHLKYPWTPLGGVLVSRGGRLDHDCNEMAKIGSSNNFSRIFFCADTLNSVLTYHLHINTWQKRLVGNTFLPVLLKESSLYGTVVGSCFRYAWTRSVWCRKREDSARAEKLSHSTKCTSQNSTSKTLNCTSDKLLQTHRQSTDDIGT